jgi:subtilisin family serine protease
MKRLLGLFALLAALAAIAAPVQSTVVTTKPPPVSSQIVTCVKTTDVDSLVAEYGLKPRFIYHRAINGFAAPIDDSTVKRLQSDPRVLFVEPDGHVALADQTVGTGLIRMGITNFPVAHIDGGDHRINVNVAVLDTGIQLDHPDLNVVQAVDMTSVQNGGEDWNGHGTEVAGVIGALDNDFGVVGVAPGARLWSVEVIGVAAQDQVWSLVLAGVEYVLEQSNQIQVVNCSFGNVGLAPYGAVHGAFAELVNQGIVVVAAVGNSRNDIAGPDGIFGTDDDIFPAALPEVSAVSAMNPTNDTIAPWSNFSQIPRTNGTPAPGTLGLTNYVFSPGGAIDVAAPGTNILSTSTNSGYAYDSGTSFAAPHVAGLVALYIAANGAPTNAAGVYAIRQAIINNSLPQSQWRPNGQPFNPVTNPTGDPDTNPEPLAMPSENWVPQPFISSATNTPAGFEISFPAVPGYDYTAQSSGSLALTSQWSSLASVAGTGSVTTVSVTDTNPVAPRFYRLARQPAP